MGSGAMAICGCVSVPGADTVRFGLVTDIHYAERDPQIGRYYRLAKDKLAASVEIFNREKPDFVVELGDFKDAGRDETDTLRLLDVIEGEFAHFRGPRYHVLGNHDEDLISKAQFLSRIENTGFAKAAANYSFEVKGVTFVVLDGNFNADGSAYDHGNFDWRVARVPEWELAWLEKELAAAKGKVVVFCHQRMDDDGNIHSLRNAAEVRRVLEASGKVAAVYQGHDHGGAFNRINGIDYQTLPAVINGPSLRTNPRVTVRLDS